MNGRKIYLRADGSPSIGLGHIFRCLAIAEMVKNYGEIVFITRELPSQVEAEISKYCDSMIRLKGGDYDAEAPDIQSLLRPGDIIVCDGYHFRTVYQKTLKASGAKVVCIDDIYEYHFVADAVINHAGGLSPDQYSISNDTRLYLGPAYSIVRSQFWNRPPVAGRLTGNVFVCLGGADPNNDLLKVLEFAIGINPDLEYHVVTGSAYRYEEQLVDFISGKPSIHHHKGLDAGAMCALMQECDMAICSPSTVSYEYLSIGGELYLHTIADNQKSIFNYFTSTKLAFPLSAFGSVGADDAENARRGQNTIFDGKSHIRIREAIING